MIRQLPLISVIIPVYNVETYLPSCIDSIRSQCYQTLEILLIDDGSTDQCPQICDSYSKKDSRIKVIHKANGGLSSARNAGIEAAAGEYIGFVDSDDIVEPDLFSALMELIMVYHADMAECGFHYFYPGQKPDAKEAKPNIVVMDHIRATEAFLDRSLSINGSVCGKLYNRRILDLIRFPEGRLHEDAFFTYKALYYCTTYIRTERCLYHYRQKRTGSIMTVPITSKNIVDVLDAFEERNNFFLNRGTGSLYLKSKAYYFQTLLSYYFETSVKLPHEKELIDQIQRKLMLAKREFTSRDYPLRSRLQYRLFRLCPRLLVSLYKLRECFSWGKR